MDTNKAYEILGLEDGAEREAIEKKYEILLKRYKIMDSKADDFEAEKHAYEELKEAYKSLTGGSLAEKQEKIEESTDNKENFFTRLFKLDKKKTDNFFYYYKIHIAVSLVAILLISMFVYSLATRPNPDLTLAYIGSSFGIPVDLSISKNIVSQFPDAKSVNVEAVTNSGIGMEIQTKITVLMVAGDTDIFILDLSVFNDYGKQGAFVSLDNIVNQAAYSNKIKMYTLNNVQDNKTHLYGVDVTNCAVLNDASIKGTRIAAINPRAKHPDLAVKFLKFLLQAQ